MTSTELPPQPNIAGNETSRSGPERLLDRSARFKLWVPESVFQALTLLASDADVSRPELIRRLLVAHVFGRNQLESALAVQGNWRGPLFSRRAPDPGEAPLPLGKSTIDALVHVSDEVHAGLRSLAGRAGAPVGTYACYVLCWAVFGHGVYSHVALQATTGYWLGDESDNPGTRDDTL